MKRQENHSSVASKSLSGEPPLIYQNDLDQEDGRPFIYQSDLPTESGRQPFTFENAIVEDSPIQQQSRWKRRKERPPVARALSDEYSLDDELHAEKLNRAGRSGTGLSSSLGGISRRMTLSSTHSPIAHFMRDWWLELIACFFLIGALIAIIITAHEYEDHPLPNLPSGISINSILAVFNVLLKATMLLVIAQGLSHLKWTWFGASHPLSDLAVYDNASRGPLGSIWLMYRLRGRDMVSSVGALLTIAALILDPMAQQVIRYYNCQRIQTTANANLPRTNAFTELGAHAGAGLNTVSQPLQAAINGGVFVPGTQVSFDCSTGNCTFPQTASTIGMQSVCIDVSNELVFNNISVDTITTLNATLPSGLATSYNIYSANVTYMAMFFNASTSILEAIVGPRVVDPQIPRNFCASPDDTGESSGAPLDWTCRGYGAIRCQLSPAIYDISNASIGSGYLHETLTPVVTIDLNNSGFAANSLAVADLSCLSSTQTAALQDAGYTIPKTSRWLAYNVSLNYQGELVAADSSISNATRDIVPKHCIYQVSSLTMNSLAYFLSDYFSGEIIPFGTRWSGPTVAQHIFEDYGASFESVSSIMANVSSSLTTYMRQHGLVNNSAPALGQVWETDTCIRVRWAYVAFPASLTGLTVLFFIAMVIVTSHAQQGVHHDFKSSPLALLFHGLDENASRRVEKARAGESNEVGELRKEASEMWVQLQPTDRGWKFVEDDGQKSLVQ